MKNIEEVKAYELIEKRFIDDIGTMSYLLKHKKTGARVALLSNDDDNKVFYIGFRTPPADSTGVPHIIEHPDRSMMTLADASRICNREIIDECQQLICFLSHTSNTLHKAIQYAEDSHKVVTAFYLD